MEDTVSKKDTKEQTYGTLYLVSTPIGNREDITLRALRVLKKSDIVVCESLKEGARLLKHFNISKKLEPINEQNEFERSDEIIAILKGGKDVAMISDAGTPVFEDPGDIIVKKALAQDIPLTVVPGVSSIMTALVRSGFSMDHFRYAGFLSRNKDERIAQLKRLSDEASTVVILETPYRLIPILEAANSVMPERRAYLGINLTMNYETHHYGTFKELYDKFRGQRFKGEFEIGRAHV